MGGAATLNPPRSVDHKLASCDPIERMLNHDATYTAELLHRIKRFGGMD